MLEKIVHKTKEYLGRTDELQDKLMESYIKKRLDELLIKLNEKEQDLLAKETAIYFRLLINLYPSINTKEAKKIILTEDSVTQKHKDGKTIELNNPFETKEKWNEWIHFYCKLFDFTFDEYDVDWHKVKLLDGTIITCRSPYYFEKREEQYGIHQSERQRYHFIFNVSPSPVFSYYAEKYGLTEEMMRFMKDSIQYRANILVMGMDKGENRDILSLFFGQIPWEERVVLIEDEETIETNHESLVRLLVKEGTTKTDLMKASLRMRPERIVVEGLDGESSFFFLQSCNTGHDGSMGTYPTTKNDDLAEEFVQGFKTAYEFPLKSFRELTSEALDIITVVDETEKKVHLFTVLYNKTSDKLEFHPLFNQEQTKLIQEAVPPYLIEKMNRYLEWEKQKDKKENEETKKLLDIEKVDIEEFLKVFEERYHFPQIQKVRPLLKETIFLRRELMKDEHIPIGASKFGGNPDLPKGIDYPYLEDVPYSFIMQINCEELLKYDGKRRFPKKGMLYFFHLFEDGSIRMPFDYKGKEGYKEYLKSAYVFHYNGELSSLTRVEKPKGNDIERVKPAIISFVSGYTIPHPYEKEEVYTKLGFDEKEIEDVIDVFYSALPRLAFENAEDVLNGKLDSTYDHPIHQLLGEPIPYQASVEEEMAHDLKNRFKMDEEIKKEWTLFAQLEEDYDLNLLYAADGANYYYIKEEDLNNKIFDTIYSIMQC